MAYIDKPSQGCIIDYIYAAEYIVQGMVNFISLITHCL